MEKLSDEDDFNEVYADSKTVRKEFSNAIAIAPTCLFLGLLRSRKLVKDNASWRVKNEVRASEFLTSLNVGSAEVSKAGKDFIEMIFIGGNTFPSFLEKENVSAYTRGQDLGSSLNKAHNNGFAKIDSHITNFLVDKDDIYFIDNELATTEATSTEKKWDRINLLSSSAQYIDKESFLGFVEGFENSYNRFKLHEKTTASLIAIYRSIFVERSMDKIRTTYYNFHNLFRN